MTPSASESSGGRSAVPRARRLADALTVARAFLGLPLLLALGAGQAGLGWALLLLAGFSDWADGWLARRSGGGSVWGARLDPLTDKILISAPLLWLAREGTLPLWAVWLLLARELLISGWRAGQASGAPASAAGKAKTVLQFTALLLLLWPLTWPLASGLRSLGWWLFWPSLLLALSSGASYLRAGLSRPAGPDRS
ncbi:CDP-alcohol phosphatidyltransferase family protein [Synechococcus sp. BA-124 BA4]|uniref:CDP-alcohol phosphatidyltransferase family protein n=1 Tax=unclassified Synechococcus TaxID=2626047 RepID=UPI0018CCEB61|nr:MULTISPECIES: CDP-alcohol phosphatidyltransferase family protein [unclassified Synechococcus]MEA5400546.1 CDP-alcohol phosphatidyltransferase family protein [Synechococcus sp. BA-124 BA4]QPN56921.1 CDP-alcohol phosphatidyltransferase family protein [Synechococcus sp. CBW1107]CAK6695319.1 CDP-diacylglycerol--glycerol-3-phosphate 3-phosphatidyltransferase [Synechococcus sp. CBW1107]